jgi:hypothetical protein
MPMCSPSWHRTTTSLARPTRTALRQAKATSALRARATAHLPRSTRVPTPSTKRTFQKRMPCSVEPFRAVGMSSVRAVGAACAGWGPSAPTRPSLQRVEPERIRETAAPSEARPDARSRQAEGDDQASMQRLPTSFIVASVGGGSSRVRCHARGFKSPQSPRPG